MGERNESEQDNLREKVLKHIEKSGYPFEAKLARAFAECTVDEDYLDIWLSDFRNQPMENVGGLNGKISVSCGTPYLDPLEKKPRELDIRVLVPLRIRDIELQIHLFVQCKNTNRVWIFCRYGFETVPTIYGKYFNHGIEFRDKDRTLDALIRFPDPVLGADPRELCGVAKVLVKREDDLKKDEIWEACITAINATRYYRDVAKRSMKPDGWKQLMVFIPMVATGNIVYQVDLSAETAEAKEVELAYYSQQTIAEEGSSHEHFLIPIITEASLPGVVSNVVLNAIKFLQVYFAW